MDFFLISVDWLSSGILNLSLQVCVVLNVPAMVLNDILVKLSVSKSCVCLEDMMEALAPKSNSVFRSLGVLFPLGLLKYKKIWVSCHVDL